MTEHESVLGESEILEQVISSMRSGEYIVAFDQAGQALERFPNNQALQYQSVLALARMGATEQAKQQYDHYELNHVDTVDMAALEARIVKDKALTASGNERAEYFQAAAVLYEKVFIDNGADDYYPAINAATMYHLSGQGDKESNTDKAKYYAEQVLRLCAKEDSYYSYASIAEANLLLGNKEAARVALEKAMTYASDNISSIAGTKKQLSLICEKEDAVLSALALPKVMHYAGHIISENNTKGRFLASDEKRVETEIRELIDRLGIGIGYGSLAAGADILFAEALLARGAELHIVLPFKLEDFKEVSVKMSGSNWLQRFDQCLLQANSVTYSTDGQYLDDNSLFHYCSLYSMGMAKLRANNLDTGVCQLAVWDQQETNAITGTATDIKTWKSFGHESYVVEVTGANTNSTTVKSLPTDKLDKSHQRDLRAIIFGDVKGFSKLNDQQLPVFVEQVMGCLATAIHGLNNKILMMNTWGDGIFIILEDTRSAAQCAMAMQDALDALDLSEYGFTDKAELRLGTHFGPIYQFIDPITQRSNFFGAHVNRTARIEPITPPGSVYVTEAFAAQLALEPDSSYSSEYVGHMPMAKNYGQLRMYMLKENG